MFFDQSTITMESEERRNELKSQTLQELQPRVPEKLATFTSTSTKPNSKILLQALFDCAPTSDGQHYVAVEILSCETDACLEKLAKRYWDMLIKPSESSMGCAAFPIVT